MEEREAKAVTKEQVYQQQMEELGIWQEIFLPELRTLCRCERELTRAEKAWSNTAPPGGKPSFLDDHYPVIEKLRNEILQHRQALGLTPQSFRKLTGVNAGGDTPEQKDLISSKLDRIAERVAGYDAQEVNPDWWKNDEAGQPVFTLPGSEVPEIQITQDAYETLPEDMEDIVEQAFEVAAEFDAIDEELRQAVAEDMG